MPISPGTRFAQYEIIALLGKGGMGEVCLAHDTRLNRKVAIKLLPAEFTQSDDRLRRFEQEAKTVSALNHPNILTIHEIGAQHGTHFITTEFIAGQTLRDRLQQPLTQAEAIDIALQIANALAAAHDAHIIHRDIKPENVMLRKDGIVKVLDFGLAKLTERKSEGAKERLGEDDATLALPSPDAVVQTTEAGTVMGTASYMSPEQARGQKVDARTDIFSLGVVLYEMLAGKRPFAGVNMIDVLGAILHEAPAPLPTQNEAVPDELQRIVTKALQKDREARYPSVKELQFDLQTLKEELTFAAKLAQTRTSNETAAQQEQALRVPALAGSYAAPAQSPTEVGTLNTWRPRLRFSLIALAAVFVVAVAAYFFLTRKTAPALAEREPILLADFENKTGEEIWDGTLKQALAVALEQSPYMNIFPEQRVRESLQLMSRSPNERVTRDVAREICQRQGLKGLIAGSIVQLGRNYVITLEAVSAQSGEALAREQVEAEGKEQVLKALGKAATELRSKLGESLASIQKFEAPIEQATTKSLQAFKAYASGLERLYSGKRVESLSFFKLATELDQDFAMAYNQLAAIHANSGQYKQGAEYAEKAFSLRERVTEREKLPIVVRYFGMVLGDNHKQIEELELWKQIYPAVTLGTLSNSYFVIGQLEKSVEAARECIRQTPRNPGAYTGLSNAMIRLNRFDEAADTCNQALKLGIDNYIYHRNLYYVAIAQNNAAIMKQQIDWASGKPDEYFFLGMQSHTAALGGRLREANDFTLQALAMTRQRNLNEVAASFTAEAGIRKALFGLYHEAEQEANKALLFSRTGLSSLVGVLPPLPGEALNLAISGNTSQAQVLVDELTKQYPKATLVNEIWLPILRATIELQRGNPDKAIQLSQITGQFERGALFWPNYLRGQAYLQLKQGAQAAAEFQKIIDHRGWDVTSPLWPLAHLGLARAAVLQSDTTKARQYYDEFFRLWKDADADLPVLIEAKKEYEKLK